MTDDFSYCRIVILEVQQCTSLTINQLITIEINLLDIDTVLPTKNETSKTTLQSLQCLLPLIHNSVDNKLIFFFQVI